MSNSFNFFDVLFNVKNYSSILPQIDVSVNANFLAYYTIPLERREKGLNQNLAYEMCVCET